MKKTLIVLIVLFIFYVVAIIIEVNYFPTLEIKYQNHNSRYAKTNLNIRQFPKLDSKVLKVLSPNEKVIVYDSVVNGFTLILNLDSTKYGWASMSYLQNNELNKSQLQKIVKQQEDLKKKQDEVAAKKEKIKEEKTKNIKPSMLLSDAKYYAHERVLEMLKSPSTADFGLWDEKSFKWNDGSYYGYTIKGYVDSQNGFGATLRTKYSVNVGKNKKGEIATSTPVLN